MSVVFLRLRPASRPSISTYTSLRHAVTAQATAPDVDQEWSSAKPYSQIPGPKPLPIPLFGNFWRFLPFGPYGNLTLYELHSKLFKDHGPIVKLTGTGRFDIVMVNDPEDGQKVFRAEGPWPVRLGVESIGYYRKVVRKDIFQDFLGVVTTQGEEWHRNRSTLNQTMMKPQNTRNYHEPIQVIAKEFIQKMRTLRDAKNELPGDYLNELNKWALESIAYVALDTRLGCLESNLAPDSDANRMIASVTEAFDLMYKLDVMPSLWRHISTRNYRRMVQVMDIITNISLKHINRKLKIIEERAEGDPEGQSILETLLKGDRGRSAAVTMAIDMLTAGIDTTANTTAIAMYYMAKNQDAQEKLYNELKNVIPSKTDGLPQDYSNKVPYLKACQKESQRICPIVAGNARAVAKDVVLKGYQIPKDTTVVIANMYMSLEDTNFPDANKFEPERWLKTAEGPASAKNANPFVFLPFGFGPRMCIGRRFAELELQTLLAQIFRNFRVSFNYGPLEMETSILLRPKTPLRFQLEERDN